MSSNVIGIHEDCGVTPSEERTRLVGSSRLILLKPGCRSFGYG
jgi:hypothetical protein